MSDTTGVSIQLQCEASSEKEWESVKEAVDRITGTTLLALDPQTQSLSIQLEQTSVLGIEKVQEEIETRTGLRAVLKGLGTDVAAVSELNGRNGPVGVVRLAQLPNRTCFVDYAVDHMPDDLKYSLAVHEFGDLSGSSYENIGRPVHHLIRGAGPGYSSARLQVPDCDLASCIGRSVAVRSEDKKEEVLAAGIIARAAAVGHNLAKKVCDCSGKSVWEERSENQRVELVIRETDFIPVAVSGTPLTFCDLLLQRRWVAAQSLGVFRYNVSQDSLQYRIIPGRLAFIAQLNPERGALRRRPQTTCRLEMPFDANLFNFTKTKDSELLFKLRLPPLETTAVMLINNSPIEFCSSLLVPDPSQHFPQVLTSDSLLLAIAFLALSSSPDLRLGFNSLGAAASVNHLHWHVYRLSARLAIEEQPVNRYNVLVDWPIPGFAFDIETLKLDEMKKVVTRVMHIITACLKLEIAHNLFLTRRRDGQAIRVIVWPRKPEFGLKNDLDLVGAFCEFSGFFIAKTKECFDELTESECIRLLSSLATEIDVIQSEADVLSSQK